MTLQYSAAPVVEVASITAEEVGVVVGSRHLSSRSISQRDSRFTQRLPDEPVGSLGRDHPQRQLRGHNLRADWQWLDD